MCHYHSKTSSRVKLHFRTARRTAKRLSHLSPINSVRNSKQQAQTARQRTDDSDTERFAKRHRVRCSRQDRPTLAAFFLLLLHELKPCDQRCHGSDHTTAKMDSSKLGRRCGLDEAAPMIATVGLGAKMSYILEVEGRKVGKLYTHKEAISLTKKLTRRGYSVTITHDSALSQSPQLDDRRFASSLECQQRCNRNQCICSP